MILFKTVTDIWNIVKSATNVKAYFVAKLCFDAIFDKDMQLVKQIISRVDGGVPDASKRKHYANIFGDALEDVLSYDKQQQVSIQWEDYVIIALAKVVVWTSCCNPGKNVQLRKNKQEAIQIILERTGGRKSEPTKQLVTTNYVDPDWLKGLPVASE